MPQRRNCPFCQITLMCAVALMTSPPSKVMVTCCRPASKNSICYPHSDSKIQRLQCELKVILFGERQIRNYQAKQPDANAWRLILLAAAR